MPSGPSAAQLSYGPQEQPWNNAAAVDVSVSDVALSALFNAGFCTGLYVGGTGDVEVVLAGDAGGPSPVTFKSVQAGTFIRAKIVTVKHLASGAATNLIALV